MRALVALFAYCSFFYGCEGPGKEPTLPAPLRSAALKLEDGVCLPRTNELNLAGSDDALKLDDKHPSLSMEVKTAQGCQNYPVVNVISSNSPSYLIRLEGSKGSEPSQGKRYAGHRIYVDSNGKRWLRSLTLQQLPRMSNIGGNITMYVKPCFGNWKKCGAEVKASFSLNETKCDLLSYEKAGDRLRVLDDKIFALGSRYISKACEYGNSSSDSRILRSAKTICEMGFANYLSFYLSRQQEINYAGNKMSSLMLASSVKKSDKCSSKFKLIPKRIESSLHLAGSDDDDSKFKFADKDTATSYFENLKSESKDRETYDEIGAGLVAGGVLLDAAGLVISVVTLASMGFVAAKRLWDKRVTGESKSEAIGVLRTDPAKDLRTSPEAEALDHTSTRTPGGEDSPLGKETLGEDAEIKMKDEGFRVKEKARWGKKTRIAAGIAAGFLGAGLVSATVGYILLSQKGSLTNLADTDSGSEREAKFLDQVHELSVEIDEILGKRRSIYSMLTEPH